MIDSTRTDGPIDVQIAILRTGMPLWIQETADLAELAANAERAGTYPVAETLKRSELLIVDIAEWQQKLGEWQGQPAGARLRAELRILKSTLDACMDEANTAARVLGLQ